MATLLQEVFHNEDVPASLLMTIFVKFSGREALDFDAFVIKTQLRELLKEDPPRRAYNKLMAAINLVKSNEFWKDLPSFVLLSNALATGQFDPRVVDLASIWEVNLSIGDCIIIWPEEPSEFSDSILRYIQQMLKLEGYVIPPRLLLKIFGEKIQDTYENLISLQQDPLLYEIVFEVARQRTEEADKELLKRLQIAKDYAKRLELDNVDRLYEAVRQELIAE